jgi:hypothetical protein
MNAIQIMLCGSPHNLDRMEGLCFLGDFSFLVHRVVDGAFRYIILLQRVMMMRHHNTVPYSSVLSSHSNGNFFVVDPENPSGESMR